MRILGAVGGGVRRSFDRTCSELAPAAQGLDDELAIRLAGARARRAARGSLRVGGRVGGHLRRGGRIWRRNTGGSGGGHTFGRPPVRRTGIPAAFRYALAVSRRTPVASSMRRRDQPSRPSARTCCCVCSLKTLLMSGEGPDGPRRCQRLGALRVVAGFQVSISGRFWVSTEGQEESSPRKTAQRGEPQTLPSSSGSSVVSCAPTTGQRNRITWPRFSRHAAHWIPQPTIRQPYPSVRFAAKHPR